MGKPQKRDPDEEERRRWLIQLATWALILVHDVIRLVDHLVTR